MLVSAISSFKAIATQNNAVMAIMQNNESRLSMMRSPRNSEMNFNAIHQQDVKNDMALTKNKFNYQYASAWKKHCEAKMKKEMASEHKLDYKA